MTAGHASTLVPDPAFMRLLDTELSRKTRFAYVVLLLLAAMMTASIAALWLTEPTLPLRTHVAFGVMVGIGCSWVGLFTWALTARRPLRGRDRLAAGYLAVGCASVFTVGSSVVGYATGQTAPYPAAVMGLVMLGVAVAVLIKAQRRVAMLKARRLELEHELGKGTR